jgi:hypothetical protein
VAKSWRVSIFRSAGRFSELSNSIQRRWQYFSSPATP